MRSAVSAEATKILRHKAAWFLVWIYPIAFFLILAIAIVAGVVNADPPRAVGAGEWMTDTALVWAVPADGFGRLLIAAFVAILFAGEYGWNTWKLVVPHRSRSSLIAAKYALVVILFAIAYALSGAITIVMSWLEDLATGDPVPAGITVGGLLHAHGKGALAALAPFLFTIAYSSLAAILTRSTIAALVIGIVVATAEAVLVQFGPMFAIYMPGLVWGLYHALPGYHLANLVRWVGEGAAKLVDFPGGHVVALPWTTSLAIVAGWTVALIAATFESFRRQDIN
jgi:ABC-type transport system involved in multi-copper enzyme maturation permease subunit